MEDINFDVFLNLKHTFTGIRIIENVLYPTTWNLKGELIFSEDLKDDINLNIALTKVKILFDDILSSSIFLCKDNEWAFESFMPEYEIYCTNNIVLTPYEPTDDHLAVILQAKINALSSKVFNISTIELESNNSKGLVFTFFGDTTEILPKMKDWMGENYFDLPWWDRNDGSTYDLMNLTEDPNFFDFSFVSDAFKGNSNSMAKIIKPNFKPTIIKNDDK